MTVRTEKVQNKDRQRRALAIGGIVGVLVFWVTVLVVGSLDPDYSHVEHAMSVVASVQAPYSVIGRVAFVVEGLLLVGFSVGLYGSLRAGPVGTAGVAMIAIHGLGRIGEGVFAWNHLQPDGLNNTLHLVTSIPGVLAMLVAPILLAWGFRSSNRYRGYYRPTVAVAIVFAAVFIIIGPASANPIIRVPSGLGQRIGFGIWYLWLIGLAISLYRRSSAAE